MIPLLEVDICFLLLILSFIHLADHCSIPAFEKENSLQADNPDKAIDYQADIFAEGFIAKENLLVSAVGGSDIVLEAELVPESEGIT